MNNDQLQVGRTYRFCQGADCVTLVVEAAPGSERIGKALSADVAYGRLMTVQGIDKEGADCYVGSSLASARVYEVLQLLPDSGKLDEFKYMFGFSSAKQAQAAYEACTWPGMYGGIKQITVQSIRLL